MSPSYFLQILKADLDDKVPQRFYFVAIQGKYASLLSVSSLSRRWYSLAKAFNFKGTTLKGKTAVYSNPGLIFRASVIATRATPRSR